MTKLNIDSILFIENMVSKYAVYKQSLRELIHEELEGGKLNVELINTILNSFGDQDIQTVMKDTYNIFLEDYPELSKDQAILAAQTPKEIIEAGESSKEPKKHATQPSILELAKKVLARNKKIENLNAKCKPVIEESEASRKILGSNTNKKITRASHTKKPHTKKRLYASENGSMVHIIASSLWRANELKGDSYSATATEWCEMLGEYVFKNDLDAPRDIVNDVISLLSSPAVFGKFIKRAKDKLLNNYNILIIQERASTPKGSINVITVTGVYQCYYSEKN